VAEALPVLNILFVGQLPPHPGGSAVSAGQLIERLIGLGCQIHAVGPITAEACQQGDAFARRNPSLRLTRYLVPYFDVSPYEAAPDEFRQIEGERLRELVPPLIELERPDLIVLGRETFAWHVDELAGAASVPRVMLARGNPTNAILAGTYPKAQGAYFLEQYRKVDLIVTVADHMADGLRERGFESVTTIPNAVDIDQFSPRPRSAQLAASLGIEDDDIVVMLVANLHRRKRPADLLQSAALALQREPKLLYVIVGDGVQRPDLEAECRRRGIEQRFRFAGWVDYPSVPDHLNLADIVVLPSEAEGLARVYLETQACGRVLLASDIPPAREVVVDGRTGLLFRLGDVDDLAATTLRAAADPERREIIGRRARAHVEANHSVAIAAERYRDLLWEVAQRGRVEVAH
jgi:glycosyltransferase involved in cell wall biosynthesis